MATEFEYLSTTETSKLFDLVLQLATDLHVTNHRLNVLEMVLAKVGALSCDAVETFEPDADQAAALDASREARLGRLLRIITETGPAEHPLRTQWDEVLAR